MSRQGKKKKRIWLILLIIFGVLLIGAVSAFIYFYERYKGNVKTVVTVEAGDPLPEKADFLTRDWDLIELTTDLGKISRSQRIITAPVRRNIVCWGRSRSQGMRSSWKDGCRRRMLRTSKRF